MTGIEMLDRAREHAPGAKYLLLTAYADTDVAIKAINDIGLDYYLLKPWDPPEERLYPVIDDLLGDWQQANPDHTSDLRVVGHRWSERSHALKTFLARNHVPYRWYDVELTPRRSGSRVSPRPTPTTCRSCSCPTARRCAALRRSISPTPSVCAPRPSSRCTTCASSAEARPDSRPRCTPRPRDSAPSSWNARPRVARRAERGDRELPRLPEGADRLGPHPARRRAGRPASARRWCCRATSSVSRREGRCTPSCSRDRARSRRAPSSWRPASPTAGSRPTASRSSPDAASTTAPRRATPASARATTSTSSVRPTPPGRPR